MGQILSNSPHLAGRRRLLCLSGHASRSEVTQVQAMHLKLEEVYGCELSFLDGPFAMDEPYDRTLLEYLEPPFYAWTKPGLRYREKAHLQDGINHVLAYVARNGPFDGLYGFSMGALVATLAGQQVDADSAQSKHSESAARKHRGFQCFNSGEAEPWSFVIATCATDLDEDSPGPDNAPSLISKPSLHLMGQKDSILHKSKQLAARFAAPLSHVMPYAGHTVPAAAMDDLSLHESLREFFQKVRPA